MTKTRITKRGKKVTVEEIKKDDPLQGFVYRTYSEYEPEDFGVFVDWSGDSYRGSGW